MARFEVEIVATNSYTTAIEADTVDEARGKALQMLETLPIQVNQFDIKVTQGVR